MDIEQNLRAYESDTAPEATIRSVITDAYGSLKPELETIHKYETEQLPSFYDAYSGFGMGTGAADMSPLARLQSATGNVATKSALARTARDIFGTRKAGMEDLIGQTYRQWQSGYQGAQNAWQRWWQQKQHEDAMKLANKKSGGYSLNWPDGGQPQITDFDALKKEIQWAQRLKEIQAQQQQTQADMERRSADPIAKIGNFLGGIFGR
jgi:hypothetical protein